MTNAEIIDTDFRPLSGNHLENDALETLKEHQMERNFRPLSGNHLENTVV